MKKIFNYLRNGLMLCATAFAFTACGDDPVEPTPTPTPDPKEEIATDIQGAHFDETNETLTVLDATGEVRTVTYTLTREKTEGKILVGVETISATQGISIPDIITFEAGSATANFVVTAPAEVEAGSVYEFEVSLKNADQYAETGATRFSATIAFPKKQYARMWFSSLTDEYGYFLNDVYDLGNGKILFPDFMHSGTTVTLLTDASATGQHEVDVTTTPSLKADDENYPGTGDYYLYCWQEDPADPEADGTWTQFYPHGKDARVSIEYMTFYVSHDEYDATVYNPEKKSGWFQLSEVKFSDRGEESYWAFLNFVIVDSTEGDGFDYSEPEEIIVDPNSLEAFVGTYTFSGTEPYCDAENYTPAANYEVEIYIENDELRMNGLLGQAYDYNGENETYLVGKYNPETNEVTFGDGVTGQYVWETNMQKWFYVYDVKLAVERDDNGKVVRLHKDNTWYFYGLGDDNSWPSASYSSMSFQKK